jgi:hypothetical protein
MAVQKRVVCSSTRVSCSEALKCSVTMQPADQELVARGSFPCADVQVPIAYRTWGYRWAQDGTRGSNKVTEGAGAITRKETVTASSWEETCLLGQAAA